MILLDVKSYMSNRGRATLQDLSTHFTVEPDAMRGLMDTWIAKGRARRVSEQLPCGTCGKCESADEETYEWLDATRLPRRACGN